MRQPLPCPDADAIALLEPFPGLPLSSVSLVHNGQQAREAADALRMTAVWGYDTESRPTFHKDQASDGPHTVQLATADRAWVFQLHDADCRALVAELLAWPHAIKPGFGLRDDCARIQHKLGVAPAGVVELNAVFRQRGYRREVGLKTAVALLFNQRFSKSKRTATTNWAAPQLTSAQVLYAANDAYGAFRVHEALNLKQP